MKLMNSLKIELFKIFFPGKYQEYARFFKAEELKVQLKINILPPGGPGKHLFSDLIGAYNAIVLHACTPT